MKKSHQMRCVVDEKKSVILYSFLQNKFLKHKNIQKFVFILDVKLLKIARMFSDFFFSILMFFCSQEKKKIFSLHISIIYDQL